MTGIAWNGAGRPLLEIVTEPAMDCAEEAVAYAKTLHSLVRWIGICDGNMQEGSFRCDANVSVRRPGAPLGTRCEIKNLNSFRFLEKAIEYEVRRQVALIEDGGSVVQETRLFDPDKGETRPMRSKEDAHDYRYFPDPDLLPLEIGAEWIREVSASLPELPEKKRRRYIDTFSLTTSQAAMLTSSFGVARYFEAVVGAVGAEYRGTGVPNAACNWITGIVSSHLNESHLEIEESPVSAEQLAELILLNFQQRISNRASKEVFSAMWNREGTASEIIDRRNLTQISDEAAIGAVVEQVLSANPALVSDYRAGKEKAFNALVGQVMKATRGKANPQEVNRILRAKLGA